MKKTAIAVAINVSVAVSGLTNFLVNDMITSGFKLL